MISFALVGGKENSVTRKRFPMSCEDVINLYIEEVSNIFKKAKTKYWSDTFVNQGLQRWIPFQVIPYTQKGMKKMVEKNYGLTMTLSLIHI